jgi:diguanylate cyclase (GGDEF)-like protein
MDQVFTGFRVHDSTQRFHVQGTITYYQPGSAVVLQNGSRSLWISTQTREPLKVDDLAEATGFPDVHSGFLALTRSEIQDRHEPAPITPLPVTWQQMASSGNIFDLVSIEGEVVTEVREALQDEYVLASDGRLFTAVYRHPAATSLLPLPSMKMVPLGSRVRVTGVCIPENSNPFDYDKAFNILLRSFADINVVAEPSWLNIQTLTRLVIALLLVVIVVGAWGLILMKKVHRQTTAMAARTEAEASLERRRSLILENINGATSLAEIIEQITDMVSCKLDGAPCCCQIADGAHLGMCPPQYENLRVVRMNIRGRSGPLLGSLIAGLQPLSKPSVVETEALAVGAGLATLAIETRRLYSDLLRRSEFDLLTDIQNRFSFDKRLEAQVEKARLSSGVFGLIYVDLDEFKQVNDEYGHQVGDLYLQQVVLRMKHQVRSVDLLARIGGDEFTVLVPEVRNRADVEEIALRIERSFDEPVAVAGHILHASASVGIALYPEDALTKHGLLNVADSAMYKAKNIKKQIAKMLV